MFVCHQNFTKATVGNMQRQNSIGLNKIVGGRLITKFWLRHEDSDGGNSAALLAHSSNTNRTVAQP